MGSGEYFLDAGKFLPDQAQFILERPGVSQDPGADPRRQLIKVTVDPVDDRDRAAHETHHRDDDLDPGIHEGLVAGPRRVSFRNGLLFSHAAPFTPAIRRSARRSSIRRAAPVATFRRARSADLFPDAQAGAQPVMTDRERDATNLKRGPMTRSLRTIASTGE